MLFTEVKLSLKPH